MGSREEGREGGREKGEGIKGVAAGREEGEFSRGSLVNHLFRFKMEVVREGKYWME